MKYPDDSMRFAAAMNWLAEKFPKNDGPRVLTKQDLSDLFEALKGISIGGLEYAAKWHFQNKQFFPRPIELIEAARGYRSTALALPEHTVPKVPAELKGQYESDCARVMGMCRAHAPVSKIVKAMGVLVQTYPGLELWEDCLRDWEKRLEKESAE